ncbi:MAG TPA: sigma-70 family RNA polymerase sigma factor [Tepidisphaeraceae bacterium]|jgi:RNA polymerase sigma factor (sigma-70 family)|nr:sigma-70 family RNA polymerase sigma factor [Tepidisphaeraceae bacterium]
MQFDDDLELLNRFSREGSQAAFTLLVSRHVNLVYSAALRQVHDPATAEDVTQAVFVALASNVAGIRPGTILPGWLLLTTRYAAKDALRAARRRSRHEQAAARQRTVHMQKSQGSSSAFQEAADRDEQSRLETLLDAVLAKLGTAGRDAIVLRFFESNSFADVGRRLGISEEAAKKRVGRSLIQMRALLLRHGINLGPEGIGSMLGAVAVRTAPPALAAKASQAALAAASVSVAKGAIAIMAWTKAKTAAVVAAALLLGGGGTAVAWHMMHGRSVSSKTVLLPPGQITPAVHFTWQVPEAPVVKKVYDGPAVVGFVRTADGTPVAGATVMLSSADADVVFRPSRRARPVPTVQTGADGRFEFRPGSTPYGVLVTCDQGIGVATVAKLVASADLVIQPWGRIDGTARLGSKPLSKSKLFLWPGGFEIDEAHVRFQFPDVATDQDGHFVVNRLPPGPLSITWKMPGGTGTEHSLQVQVQGGTTTYIIAGGTGRPVIGRVNPPPREGNDHIVRLQRLMPEPFDSQDWEHLTAERRAKLMAELEASPDYPAWERDCNPFETKIGPDGTFHLDDIPAGKYTMLIAYWNSSNDSRYLETIGELERKITVDPMPGGRNDEPLDLGTLDLPLRKRLALGEAAPELTWRDADGRASSLQSLRGKYVLGIVLRDAVESDDMWEELLKLKPVYDRFGCDPRLVMLALYAGKDFDAARQSVARAGVVWPLVSVGKSLDSLPDPYRSSGEMMFVIDPQGAVLGKDLEPQRAWYVLDQALSHSATQESIAGISVQHLGPGQDPRSLLPTVGANAAAQGTFAIVDGIPGKWSLPSILVSGTLPASDDARTQNFCFTSATLEGRLRLDLGRRIAVHRITTFSRHKSDRAPQLYTLYISDGSSSDFDPAPKIGTDPAAHGWTRLANVDSRPILPGPKGGTYAVTLMPPSGNLHRCRYLLFEMFPTETVDQYGHTFYSQICVDGS